MAVKNFKKFLEISKVCNKTFGVSSDLKSATESVILKAVDDEMLSAMFIVVVNYGSEDMWISIRKRWVEEGLETIEKTLKKVAQEYKDNTGQEIKLEVMKATLADSMELLSYSMYNPKKTGYFRLNCNVKVV